MRVLVLGGYGLIGLEIMRVLKGAGHDVIGFGRSAPRGRRLAPDFPWTEGDMARMSAGDWMAPLAGVEAVVNAAGALQDGSRDSVEAVHHTAAVALLAACARRGVTHFVQVSAPGATVEADTAFLRTKAAGDAAVRASGLDWTILKPGLVIGAGAYGGTALVRMLAAFPLVQPVVLADAKIQTVAASDVADAVRAVLGGEVESRRDYDLADGEVHTLSALLKKMRNWSGREDALWEWRLPRAAGYAVARLADVAGWMGWRSPLRTTALKSLEAGVVADVSAWRAAGGARLKSLDETLAALPSTMQERVFGRAQLVFPFLVLTLAAFWIASGLIGGWRREEAAAVLDGAMPRVLADGFVIGGVVADLLIGWGLLWRRWTRRAAWASIVVSLGYLAAGTVLTPHLWLDPLGVFVKVFPAMALALAVAALAEER